MMMGCGSYGHGGGSSSSSSNLSALAPPFTVDRSVSKPLVDLTEPPLNWLNTHSLNFDSTHSSNAYGYPFNPSSAAHMPSLENSIPVTSIDSFLFDQNSDAIPTATNLVEAKHYYPSYVSPPKYGYDDYTQSLSGLWDGSRNWEYGKTVQFGDSICSKEINVPDFSYKDYANQGAQSTKGLSTCVQNSNSNDILGGQKHLESASRVQIEHKSYRGNIFEFTPAVLPIKSVLEQGCSGNHQPSYCASYEKGGQQCDISSSDISSVSKSSPGFIFRSQAIGPGSSAPDASSLNSVENGGGVNNTDFSGNNNFPNTKDFHPLQSSEAQVHFDSSQLSFHLEGDNHRFPDMGPMGFNLTLASNGAVNHFEGTSESLDHYNPAVDSPCWKGATMYQFSPLEISGPISSQLRKKMEIGNSSNSIEPADCKVKFSALKPSEYSVYQEKCSLENDSASFPKPPSLASLSFGEHGYDHDLKAGSYQTKSNCSHGVQFSDCMDKPRKDHILSNNAVDEFNIKSFHSMQQNFVADKLPFGNRCESATGVPDVEMNTNDASEGCSSHVPFHATEHVLSSPPVEIAPSKLPKLHVEELAPKICARTLISTIHNLSELLLFQCSNEVCELKENDIGALKNVVNNLDKCISKALKPEAPSQEYSLPGKCSQFCGGLPELHEVVTVNSPEATKAAVSVLNQIPSDYQHVQEESVRHIMSGKKDDKSSDFTSRRDNTDRVKDDNMTQAIKKVLSENFVEDEDTQPQILLYKNLWLEAEAALCSVNYKARFDRMKIELERSVSSKAKVSSEDTTEPEKSSQSTYTYTPDLNTDNKLPTEVKNDWTQDISDPDYSIINTSHHPADVMARFHILKCLGSNANCSSTDVEKRSSSNSLDDMNQVDKMASEAKNDQNPYISTCGSPNASSTSHTDDVEASVIARFCILRSRIENSIHASTEDQLSPQVTDLGFAGEGKHWAEDGILDVNMEPVLQHDSVNHTQDQLTMNEFHLRIKDDPVIKTHQPSKLGNQNPASCYNSSSSDWEHVLKEDLLGQNC